MAGLEKLQRGARRRDEGPLWAGCVECSTDPYRLPDDGSHVIR